MNAKELNIVKVQQCIVMQNEFPNSHKYWSLALIMQITFPIDVSFPEYFSSQNIFIVPQSPNDNIFSEEKSDVCEDRTHNLDTKKNYESSTTTNQTFEHVERV